MNITVLSIEGLGAAVEGWRLSRDYSQIPTTSDILTLDLPVNELPTCHLLIDGATIIEREIFMSLRNHVAWARTSHVDDPLEFTVPECFSSLNALKFNARREAMKKEKAEGRSQDEWRRHLPIISETSWTTRISYRDLVKLAGYFMRLSVDTAIVWQLRVRFDDVAKQLGRVLDQFTGDPAESWRAVDTMAKVDFLHKGDVSSPIGVVETGDFFVVTVDVPLWLRAQIVRHRPLSFVDDFYFSVLCDPAVLDITIDAMVRMEIATTKAFWHSVLSKRTCWLAQDQLRGRRDPWQVIIDQFGFRDDMLPCASGRCPYHKDASLRVSGDDPGVPCPAYCDIYGVDKAPYRDAMREAAKSRHESWMEKI